MRIDKISATHFKNFTEISVEFEPGVNLFVGANGSGKTSILEIVNIALGGFFVGDVDGSSRPVQRSEMQINRRIRQAEVVVSAESSDMGGYAWTRIYRGSKRIMDDTAAGTISSIGQEYLKNYFFDPEDRHLAPLFAYYSTQRLSKELFTVKTTGYDAALGRRNGYVLCLREIVSKRILVDWWRNASIRRASKYANGIDSTDLILQNVEQAVRRALTFGMDISAETDLRIYPDPDFNNEIFISYDDAHDLPLSFYSDGFRNLVYMAVDMVWRASQLNPWLDWQALSDQTTGVVTIDEIDLHLHPRWQMKAIGLFQMLFPKVQFIITTHSPTVIANMQNGTLYIINENQITRHSSEFFGKQIDNVMRNVLGAPDRNVVIQARIDHLLQAIDMNNKDLYTKLLEELENLLGEDDADIQKAKALIEMQNYQEED